MLDADVRELIDDLDALELPRISEVSPDEARQQFHTQLEVMRGGDGDRVDVAVVRDEGVPGRNGVVPTRVYDPRPDRSAAADVVVFLHGGGWMVGDLDTHDPIARRIAVDLELRVVSVDYRRAPEHPFPAALADCLDVIDMIAGDPLTTSVSVAGDSAGGNLAAATAIACRDRGGPALSAQLLIYPALDPGRAGGSVDRFAEGYVLTKDDMEVFDARYLAEASHRTLPLVAPAAATTLAGLPPAVVSTAGFDVLLDEGHAYARRLIKADVPTVYLPFPTLIHGWLGMTPRVPAAIRARDAVLEAFGAVLTWSRSHRPTAEVVG